MGHPAVEALVRIMPPEHGADEGVDWDAVEAQFGTPLPADYRAFMAVYGGGSIGGQLSILPPLQPDDGWDDMAIAGETASLRYYWEQDGGVPGAGLGADAVLAWGVGSSSPDLLGWLRTGPNPDEWPVVVWRRHVSYGEPAFVRFDSGMAEFLRRLLVAELDECPLSDVSLWGRPERFVHWREQQRRFRAGLDPITGEPDPYAGMFPAPNA